MLRVHICYANNALENQLVRAYIMYMMMIERKQSLITNAPVVNGEFVNLSDRVYYEQLLADVREQNRANRAEGIRTR